MEHVGKLLALLCLTWVGALVELEYTGPTQCFLPHRVKASPQRWSPELGCASPGARPWDTVTMGSTAHVS